MQEMTGFTWEVTTENGKKYHIIAEGWSLEEGLANFRRIQGYSQEIITMNRVMKLGEQDD